MGMLAQLRADRNLYFSHLRQFFSTVHVWRDRVNKGTNCRLIVQAPMIATAIAPAGMRRICDTPAELREPVNYTTVCHANGKRGMSRLTLFYVSLALE